MTHLGLVLILFFVYILAMFLLFFFSILALWSIWHKRISIPTRGNLFLPVRLLVWADGRGTVAQADSAARAKLQGSTKQKLLQLKNI
jgi:hypothetical protein